MSPAPAQTARMNAHTILPGSDRNTRFAGGGEIATETVLVAATAAALVIAPTLVALTRGWDYRLAVMLGATLAVALARWRWRTLPRERFADRLAAAFAGTLATGLLCIYSAAWLDWQPFGIDGAVAGTTIGLLILVVPVRGLLHQAPQVPAAAGLVVLILAATPAGWAAFISALHSDTLDPAARYALIEGPGLVATVVLTAVGFAFALRRGLFPAAAAMSVVAWAALWMLLVGGGASGIVGTLVGGLAGTALMIASSNASAKAMRNAPRHAGPVTACSLGVRARAFAERALRALRLLSPTPVALATLALAPAARAMFPLTVYGERLFGVPHVALTSTSVLASLAVAGFAFVLEHRLRLYRTALVSSAFIGIGLFGLFDKAGAGMVASVYVGTIVGGAFLFATLAAWRAFAHAKAARPGGLIALLAVATVWALLRDIGPLEYLTAAAAIGVWWWYYLRRGERLFGTDDAACPRRQSILCFALAGIFGLTLKVYIPLLAAAVHSHTGAMVLVVLRESGVYAVSELTFARAALADQYLWRDSVSPPRPAAAVDPYAFLAASRHKRDRWTDAYPVWMRDDLKDPQARGYGFVTRGGPGEQRVQYVYRGSPAARAGVRRGDVIRAMDGIRVREGSVRLELVAPGGEVREVTVEASEYLQSAVGAERVLDVAGRRVGYLELHLFRRGAAAEFSAAALRLRKLGIDELVLDLRMNPGGYVREMQQVASVIAGERLNGKVFTRLVHNERYRTQDRDLYFTTPPEGALRLTRLFVLTSKDTCSASEGLINGLAPHMTIIAVGGTTCGKPVGSPTLEYGEHAYTIIAFRGLNARGEGDYYAGLHPVCGAADPGTHDLGDPADPSLAAALHYIRHGSCPPPASSVIL